MQRPVPSVQTAQKIVEVPQIQHVDEVVNMPVVIQRQVPMTLNVQKSVEVAGVTPHDESNLEQDACASVDESLGCLSQTDPRPEEADAELASREKRSHAGEMILTTGDHELKVIVHVECIKGEASAQEREIEPPSKRRKQESDQIPMHFSLCDD